MHRHKIHSMMMGDPIIIFETDDCDHDDTDDNDNDNYKKTG
jgi:hypothetical protein